MKKLYALGVILLLIFSIQTVHADSYPDGCTATTKYSSTTGHPCATTHQDCAPGDLYSSQTGKPCTSSTYLPGCTSTIGYSVTTGQKCDGSSTQNSTVVIPTVTPVITTTPTQTTTSTSSDTYAFSDVGFYGSNGVGSSL